MLKPAPFCLAVQTTSRAVKAMLPYATSPLAAICTLMTTAVFAACVEVCQTSRQCFSSVLNLALLQQLLLLLVVTVQSVLDNAKPDVCCVQNLKQNANETRATGGHHAARQVCARSH